jgi:integrase
MVTHLKRKQGGVYYAQIAVPTDVQSILGAKMKERSLRTRKFAEAKELLPDVIKEWKRMFAEAKDGKPKTSIRPLLSIEQIAARLYRSQVEFDTEIRATPHAGAYARMGVDLDLARRYREGFSGTLSDNELDQLIGARVERARSDGMHNHAKFSDEWRVLAQALCLAMYEAMEREDERNNGNFNGTPSHPLIANAKPEAKAASAGEAIMDLFAIYAAENPKSISADTLNQARRDIGNFVEHVGTKAGAAQIDKKSVREWKALLMKYPVKATETKAFEGMKLAQIVAHNETVGKPVLTPRTVNRYLSSLGAFCSWLVNHGYIDNNPTEGMSLAKDKKKKTYPFSSEQMNTLFSSPLFVGCENSEAPRFWNRPGKVRIRDHRYWVPLIMLYSGARPAEIAQLNVADVRQEHGHWIMDIVETTDEDEDDIKTVKNEGSRRVVPVHDKVIELGFLGYYEGIKNGGGKRLFPLAQRNSRGQMIADFSREFGRYLTKIGVKKGRGFSLYSFRHGAFDALRRAGYRDEEFGYIFGHVSGNIVTRGYGVLPQGMLQQRVDLIKVISYSGLEIDHLK